MSRTPPEHRRDWQDRFDTQLRDGVYEPETEQFLRNAVRVGHVSAQKCFEIINILEVDRHTKDAAMNGMTAPDWYAEHDRVFMPGEIGAVPTKATLSSTQ